MLRTLTFLVGLFVIAGLASAQPKFDDLFDSPDIDVGRGLLSSAEPQVTAVVSRSGDVVTLSVRVDLPEGGNTYSQDAKAVAPARPTKFEIKTAAGLTPIDAGFTPSHPPKKSYDENFRTEVEKHFGTVTWSRKYRAQPGADPSRVSVSGVIDMLYCKDSCRPLKLPFTASLAAPAAAAVTELLSPADETTGTEELPPPVDDLSAPPAVEEIAAGTGSSSSATITAEPSSLAYSVVPQYGAKNHTKGDPARVDFILDTSAGDGLAVLAVRMTLGHDFHVRALTKAPGQSFDATELDTTSLQGLTPVAEIFTPTTPAELSEEDLGGEVLRSLDHHEHVTWTRVYRVEPGAAPGVQGTLTFQVCRGSSFCLPPKQLSFALGSLLSEESVTDSGPTTEPLTPDERQAALAAAGLVPAGTTGASLAKTIAYEDEAQSNSLPTWLLFAFLGGLILNVMPCVLPVISIKALSFVHQAGEQPGRILLLNVVYSLGVLSVFFALATLALTLKLGWGAQNQSAAYNIVMVAVVFAMGLSLLGVFEIPIPGMMSSGIGGKQHGEGLVGAFLTGILATLLATPCTGPYMATTLFWSLQQPAHIVFLIFGVMGLGMASPYLMIGIFPALIDWLPRPGNWMVTFKQVCGFLLMGTSVWMLNTIQGINSQLVIPTLIILVGVAVMTWMVGQLYNLSSTQSRRWTIRGLAVLIGGLVIALGTNWAREATELAAFQNSPPSAEASSHGENALPWEPFSEARLAELVQAGTPVLVDFTADWCGICKANELRALNTEPTSEFVERHGFATLMADYTRENPEIRQWLNKFGQDSVPLTIVIPAGQPNKTKILRESFSQQDLLEKLNEAVVESSSANLGASTAARPAAAVSLTR